MCWCALLLDRKEVALEALLRCEPRLLRHRRDVRFFLRRRLLDTDLHRISRPPIAQLLPVVDLVKRRLVILLE